MATDNGTDARDYYEEARLILANRTLAMVERGHLVAMQAELNRLSLVCGLMNRALIAVLIDKKQPSVDVPADLVKQIEDVGLDLSIGRQENGPIRLALMHGRRGD